MNAILLALVAVGGLALVGVLMFTELIDRFTQLLEVMP